MKNIITKIKQAIFSIVLIIIGLFFLLLNFLIFQSNIEQISNINKSKLLTLYGSIDYIHTENIIIKTTRMYSVISYQTQYYYPVLFSGSNIGYIVTGLEKKDIFNKYGNNYSTFSGVIANNPLHIEINRDLPCIDIDRTLTRYSTVLALLPFLYNIFFLALGSILIFLGIKSFSKNYFSNSTIIK